MNRKLNSISKALEQSKKRPLSDDAKTTYVAILNKILTMNDLTKKQSVLASGLMIELNKDNKTPEEQSNEDLFKDTEESLF